MGGPGDYPLLGMPKRDTRIDISPSRRPKRNNSGVKSKDLTKIVDRVANMPTSTKRALEISASERLRTSGPKLKKLKTIIRFSRVILYCFALSGVLVTCMCIVVDGRMTKRFSPESFQNSTLNSTLGHDGKMRIGFDPDTWEYIRYFRDFWDLFLVSLVCFISNHLRNLHEKKDDLEDRINEDVSVLSAARYCTDVDPFYHDYRDRISSVLG